MKTPDKELIVESSINAIIEKYCSSSMNHSAIQNIKFDLHKDLSLSGIDVTFGNDKKSMTISATDRGGVAFKYTMRW